MDSSLWTFSIDKPFPLGRFNYVFQEYLITLNSLEMSEEKIPITTISLEKKKKKLSHVSFLCNKNWTTRRLHQYYWALLVSLRPRLKAHEWEFMSPSSEVSHGRFIHQFPFRKSCTFETAQQDLERESCLPEYTRRWSLRCKDSSGVFPLGAQVQLAGVFSGSCLCASKSSL